MRLITLKLDKFKRFALNAIRSFTLTPRQRVQLILGTNGSGKSSLLREISPLPPNPASYEKDGVVTKCFEHQSFNYVLTSTLSGGAGKHSFKRAPVGTDDYEELNPGKTVTVQRELVKQFFNMTEDVQDLLVGKERFTRMSPGRRREWLTRLSEVDYTYALRLYDKLRESYRDVTGAIKRTNKTLVAETSKLMSQEDVDRLTQEVELLHKQLSTLQSVQAPLLNTRDHYQHTAESLTKQLDSVSRSMQDLAHELVLKQRAYRDDPRSVEEIKQTLHAEIAVTQSKMDTAYTAFKELEETVAILKTTSAADIGMLQDRVQATEAAIAEKENSLRLSLPNGSKEWPAVLRQSSFLGCYEGLLEIINNIPSNEDKHYSSTGLQALQEKKAALLEENHRLGKERDQLISECRQMEHHKNHSRLECPKCRFGWSPSYSEDVFQAKQALITAHTVKIEQNTATIQTDIGVKLEEFEVYRKYYSDFIRLTRSYPQFEDLWDAIQLTVATTPRAALLFIEDYRGDLDVHVALDELVATRNATLELIEQTKKVGNATLEDSQEKLGQIEHDIQLLTIRRNALTDEIATLTRIQKLHTLLAENEQRVQFLMASISSNTQEAVDAEMRRMIKDTIRTIQTELAIKTEALTGYSIQKNYVVELEKTLSTLTLEGKALKQLVDEMSPTEGLIADGMLGFIRIFTAQMNKVIKKVCTYPLVVQPCGIDTDSGAELSYKFPFTLLEEEHPVPDIGDASAGQEEIINLAFRILAMQHMGFKDYPLILDEFGAALDTEHRNNANHAISAILEQCSFSQLFMVSHYESSYGFFTNVDICVLDSRNITTPGQYNQHVTLA